MPDFSKPCAVTITEDDANRLVWSLMCTCPNETAEQIYWLFLDKGKPFQASSLFDHAFTSAPYEIDGVIIPVVGFRLRNADELTAAINALYVAHVTPPVKAEVPP